jgi:hypothetical protein
MSFFQLFRVEIGWLRQSRQGELLVSEATIPEH